MTLEQIAALYPGGKFTRPDHYETRCPLPAHRHGDRNPGLGITQAADGKILIYCQLGCEREAVLAAAGLTFKDLAPPAKNGSALPEPEDTYLYQALNGEPLAEKVRFPGKRFTWRLPGAARWGLEGVKPGLYRLPGLLRTKPGDSIGIAEGEKDVDNLCRRGLPSTCNPDGAALPGQTPKWREQYTECLKEHFSDRRFVVFADQDEAGLAHAEAIHDSLSRAGLPVRIAAMTGLKTGEDVSDWLGRHTDAEFQALLDPPAHPLDLKVLDGEALENAEIPTPDALVPHLLYRGFVTLLAGDSKLGKSSLELRAILASCCGGWWLDRDRRPENRLSESRILYVNFEDPLFVTRDRARKMMSPEPLPKNFLTMPPPYGVTLPDFLDWLYGAHRRLMLDALVLDPIAIAAEWTDETDNAEVARTLKPLGRLAAETMLSILLAHHVTKKPGQYGLNIRGASAIKANVLGYLVLEREKELFKLSGINKLSGDWDVTLDRTDRDWSWWIVETRAGHTRTPHQAAKEQAQADLLVLIGEQPLVTTERLAALLGLNERTCRRYLTDLKEGGILAVQELPPRGKGGNRERGWIRLPSGTD